MADISAKDVKALRDATGAGMLDAKKALVENDGDFDNAARGCASGVSGRRRSVPAGTTPRAPWRWPSSASRALVQLKSETDFVAKSPPFVDLAEDLARWWPSTVSRRSTNARRRIDDLKVTLKENIELGRVIRLEAPEGNLLEGYLHEQNGRGINGVLVEMEGGTPALPTTSPCTSLSASPAT